jgi:hypothetical protein
MRESVSRYTLCIWNWMSKYSTMSIILIFGIVFLFKQCEISKLRDSSQLAQVELSSLKDSVETVVAKNGNLTFKIMSTQLESDNAKKALELAGFEIKDLKSRNIKYRDINIALKAQLSASGSGQIALRDTVYIPIKGDSVFAKVGSWDNGFLSLKPELIGNKLNFDYNYRVGIKIIGEDSKTISIALTDPRAKITSANSIIIKPRRPFWDKWYIYGAAGLISGYFLFK